MRYRYRSENLGSREKAFIVISMVAIVLFAAAVFSGRQAGPSAGAIDQAGLQDLSTSGFVAVRPMADLVGDRGVVSLEGGCNRVVAGTDLSQAESIKDGLGGLTGPRPNTHELMRDTFKVLGVDVVMVKVTELRDQNFIGRIILQQGNTILALDSRPSDGIALALRTGATIYFNETLLKEMGEKIC